MIGLFARVLALVSVIAGTTAAAAIVVPADPFLWLEDVHGARAQAWVKAENAKTLAVLQHDPHFAGFYAASLALNGAEDRIPYPALIDGRVYSFWQDARHPRGIWRTTTSADYAARRPAWKTVLDLDALAKSEGKNWIWQSADCDSPSGERCLITLSEGGEDASTVREFDLPSMQFVAGGFVLPHGKQSAAWAGDDALLVAREWEPGELTASGYPFVVKTLARGQPLSAAVELTRGSASDVDVSAGELHDGDGHRVLFVRREVSFFEGTTQLLTSTGLQTLDVPRKSDLQALVAGRLVIALHVPWKTNGRTYPAGALVAVDLNAATADPQHLKPVVVYAPGPREAFDAAQATRDGLVVTWLDNVRGRAAVYTPVASGGWSARRLAIPDNTAVDLVSTDERGSAAYLSVAGFLTPTTLLHVDTRSGSLTVAKALAARFDASHDVVEQHAAASNDGTRIPYFIVRPKAMRYDGRNPTLIYAYGGFAVSQTPFYSGNLGRLWLTRGGVFVLANIRGGGEFGPAWHEAGLKTHRQRIFDDFAAVGRDLIARRVTTPRRLGIEGGSNGGLLMGVEFTQHPELWNAVDIQVPLLDMLRYEKIAAGASWTGEYGSVAVPRERAFLAAISPYNNLKAGVRYPKPLVWTTTKDDRVGPQHARKFAAKLAALKIPYYFYELTEGGHGSGANINERSFMTALEYTYLTRQLMTAGR